MRGQGAGVTEIATHRFKGEIAMHKFTGKISHALRGCGADVAEIRTDPRVK